METKKNRFDTPLRIKEKRKRLRNATEVEKCYKIKFNKYDA